MRFLLPIFSLACVGSELDSTLELETPVLFGFPLAEPNRFPVLVGVDHDRVKQEDTFLGSATCTDYIGRGFPNCYDQHKGNDYILNGDFEQMDLYPADILAAADGTVISIEDGHYDKCQPDENFEIDCDGNPIIANHVKIEHKEGVISLYWHLRIHSVRVAVGDTVSCGDIIGEVGSSGRSSKPHLHFEISDSNGDLLNPYAGPLSQPLSWWETQNAPDVLPGAGCTTR